jgi:hypothetical protein
MQEFHSKIAVVLAIYRVVRAIELTQAITGETSELLQMRDAVIQYIPIEEQPTLLFLVDSLIEGRMPDMAKVKQVLDLIQHLDNDTVNT